MFPAYSHQHQDVGLAIRTPKSLYQSVLQTNSYLLVGENTDDDDIMVSPDA